MLLRIKQAKNQKRWDVQSVIEEAKKYHTRQEFKKGSSGAYHYAHRKKFLEQIYKHMPPTKFQKSSGADGNSKQIRRLSKSELNTLLEMNEARSSIGLSAIKVKVRTCIVCGKKFESTGNRICGCRSGRATTLLGFEII